VEFACIMKMKFHIGFGSNVESFYMDARSRNTYQYFIMHITFPAKGQLAYSMTAARFLLEIMNMI
jgi:hypothetical protein